MFNKINWRALVLATIGFLAFGTAAIALSGSANTNYSARKNTTQQTNYYRFTLNYNDAKISTGVKFGRLPSGAFVTSVKCDVGTAFNAGTTNVVTVGTTWNGLDVFGASDLNELSKNYQALSTAAGLGKYATSAGEADLYARYFYTGTAPTAGAVTCVIEYAPDNDQ
jgi:hypothetical protein